MAQPVISYPGAKWRFWEHIKPYIPRDIKDWREPFFGGGSMSLCIADDPEFNLERMVVGDLAPEIWALWTGIRNNAPDVREIAIKWFEQWCPTHSDLKFIPKDTLDEVLRLEKIYKEDKSKPFAEWANTPEVPAHVLEAIKIREQAIAEGRKFWDWAAKVDCSTLSIPERSARTYLVNKISFSGMGDSGSLSKDRFTAFNPEENTERIILAQPLLQKMEINNVSFEETMKDVDPEKSFVFLDPPYYRQEESGLYGRGGDTHHGFPHDHFAEFTKNTNCRWFVTYDDSIKVRKMFRGKTAYGGKCYLKPFVIPGGYTMAQKNSEDALAGEELFIANYDIISMDNITDLTGKI